MTSDQSRGLNLPAGSSGSAGQDPSCNNTQPSTLASPYLALVTIIPSAWLCPSSTYPRRKMQHLTASVFEDDATLARMDAMTIKEEEAILVSKPTFLILATEDQISFT